MSKKKHFTILALDGGGARGIYAAQILAKMEASFGIQIQDCFDLIAGTSTGSIIAGAAATGILMKQVVYLFETEAPKIFRKKLFRRGYLSSKYSKKPLENALDQLLSSTTLGDILTPLMIISTNMSTGGVWVFKSRYMEKLGEPYYRDGDVFLKDAILSSCAAPTFFDPVKINNSLLTDGGLWANNPSIISFTEAIAKFKKEIDQVRILSIGTGRSENMYTEERNWGFLTGLGKQKFISLVLAVQSDASKNMARLLLKENYLRVNSAIETWELDDIKRLDNLKALADDKFVHEANTIKNFIGIGERN